MVLVVFFEFFEWMYGEGTEEFLKAWRNVHWFFFHFFSVPLIARPLFQPLKRLKEKSGRGFDPEKFFENLAINTLMRFVGFLIRLMFIAVAGGAGAAGFLLCFVFFFFFFHPAGFLAGRPWREIKVFFF